MKFFQIFTLCLTAGLFSGCISFFEPPMTPLQLQNLQSREYSEPKEVVFQSIISVFQDLGYTVTNANLQTGLISAESAANSWSPLDIKEVRQTKATAFVEKIGNRTRARLSFVKVNKRSSKLGQTSRQDYPIHNARTYQNAFERIESAIFVRSAN
jgi:hypothetical protein